MAINKKIIEQIFQENPYDNFPLEMYQTDLQGWGSDSYLFEKIITYLKPNLIFEVGSWKGKSAINMAKIIQKNNLKCTIICIDTWLGSVEHWINKTKFYPSLKIKYGYPSLYFTFMANVISNNVQDIIVPFPSTSENAAEFLKKKGIEAELIYIDAAHEYKPVLRDLNCYWDLLKSNGILFGDDYIGWDGVTKAVNEFVKKNKLRIIGEKGKFIIPKGKHKLEISLSEE